LKRREQFRFLEWIDIGGGLGIGLDLAMLCAALLPVSTALSTRMAGGVLSICMEPGRFIVADAGVLLTRVTQIRKKAGRIFVGAATGMNSLIRPALYSAHHGIVNLTRLEGGGETMLCDVVGPICESADVLGDQRSLPLDTSPGDVLLIEHGGAYGHCMSSRYNLREPARESVLRR
jgi:diaminopimelate decarboxylase/aspartate kinase